MTSFVSILFIRLNSGNLDVASVEYQSGAEEARGLLRSTSDLMSSQQDTNAAEGYGSLNRAHDGDDGQCCDGESHTGDDEDKDEDEDEDEKEIKALQKQRLEENGSWLGYLRGFLIFLPYILPYKDRYTQLWFAILILCVIMQRILTVMIPRQLGAITSALGGDGGDNDDFMTFRLSINPELWRAIIVWGILQFPVFAVTDMLKSMADTRISQFAYRELKAVSFAHVMNLSMDYHSSKSSGKLTKAIEQGTDLTSIIDNVFTAGPMVIDLAIAAVYLSTEFDFYMGFIVLTTSLAHIYATGKGNALTVPMKRVRAERIRVENEVLYDSITNWPTVAYHNRKNFEQDRYARAVKSSIMAERKFYDYSDYVFVVQSFALDAGLMAAASLAAYRVAIGSSTVGNFVFLVAYWASIKEPMSMLSWTFRETSSHLINAEWLYQLLKLQPTIRDKPGAHDIKIPEGRVEFRNVAFSYEPERPILRDITFATKPGQSVALVGETGGGKSTILKLLYRFYDVKGGSVIIDGQDIRDVTLDSLRDSLGAVPQDPSVFDQSLLENVRYARPGATDEECIAACKAAQVHDQIQRFPAGYGTKLGERGVRLSGGELQRLAIARVILRAPKIVVLDEATSAVDSQTESSVQHALKTLSSGRTVFIVAHRLSTVVNADIILVIDQGRIVERGTHEELLQNQGKYSRLWSMQTIAHLGAVEPEEQEEEEQSLI
jgi:ABC-type transport system involved in Fe-S cluster assembly fused permease/ATPase subunit